MRRFFALALILALATVAPGLSLKLQASAFPFERRDYLIDDLNGLGINASLIWDSGFFGGPLLFCWSSWESHPSSEAQFGIGGCCGYHFSPIDVLSYHIQFSLAVTVINAEHSQGYASLNAGPTLQLTENLGLSLELEYRLKGICCLGFGLGLGLSYTF